MTLLQIKVYKGNFLVFIMGGILTMTADSHDIFTNQSLQGEFFIIYPGDS